MRAALAILSCSVLWGCGSVDYEDVSNDARFHDLIGQQYQSNEDLLAFGITLEPNYEKVLAYVELIPYPGIDGREVLSREVFPKGTLVEAVAVRESEWLPLDCLFGECRRVEIEIVCPEVDTWDGRKLLISRDVLNESFSFFGEILSSSEAS